MERYHSAPCRLTFKGGGMACFVCINFAPPFFSLDCGAREADRDVALAMFNKGEGGFRDSDLYPFCIRVTDGKNVAGPVYVRAGMDTRTLKDPNGKAYGHSGQGYSVSARSISSRSPWRRRLTPKISAASWAFTALGPLFPARCRRLHEPLRNRQLAICIAHVSGIRRRQFLGTVKVAPSHRGGEEGVTCLCSSKGSWGLKSCATIQHRRNGQSFGPTPRRPVSVSAPIRPSSSSK